MRDSSGYTVIKDTMSESLLTKVWTDLHFLVAKQLEFLRIRVSANMKTNLSALLEADADLYVSTLSLASRLKSVSDLFVGFFNSGIYAFPSTPVLHVMADNLKVPGGYWGTEAHQDWPSTQGSLDTETVWIPITNTLGNFPLEVIPGSHHKGLLDGKINGSVIEVECEGKFTDLGAQFGDAVLMSSFLVHRTGKGGTGLRIAASLRYENVKEKTFIERGYPCAQKRMINRDIVWKPTVEEVRSVYVE